MYIRHPIRKTVFSLTILTLLGSGLYGVFWLEEREQRKSISGLAVQNRVQTLAELSLKLNQATELYLAKLKEEGNPLPVGRILSLRDLKEKGVWTEESGGGKIHIEEFVYKILPADAPDQTLKLILVSDQGRATVDKQGRGALYGK